MFFELLRKKNRLQTMGTMTTAIALKRLGVSEPYTKTEILFAIGQKKDGVTSAQFAALTDAARFLIHGPAQLPVTRPGVLDAAKKHADKPSVAYANSSIRKKPRVPRKSQPKRLNATGASGAADAEQVQTNVSVPGINAAAHEFVLFGHSYFTKPRLLVAVRPGDVFLVDLFRNPCRWHPSDVPRNLHGTFNTPNHAGEVLLQTLKPSEIGATHRRTASARTCFSFAGRDAKTLIVENAKLVDMLSTGSALIDGSS